MNNLNPQQQAAVDNLQDPLLVIAGAGSGKTSVITRKILNLMEKGTSPQHILAVTFTNKAAREMKDRVALLAKHLNTRGLRISTFHTLGLNILRREAHHLGLSSNLSLFDESDNLNLMKHILQEDGRLESDLASAILSRISQWKNDLFSPEEALINAVDAQDKLTAELYDTHQKTLTACNAVDFDDLILLPAKLFRNKPERLHYWQARTQYVLVDEYQDTNPAQYELVKLLVSESKRFTVVGDDDQAIYAWRGAKAENLAKLKEDFPSLQIVKLEQNYRSTSRILRTANQLISNNEHVFEKALWSTYEEGEPIRMLTCRDEEDEARRIASEIFIRHLNDQQSYGNFAILYRSNHQSRMLELKLREHQIPYTINGGTSLFNRTEVKDLLAYLRLMCNEDDDAAFARIINTPRRGVGPATLQRLGAIAHDFSCSRMKAIFRPELDEVLGAEACKRLREFARWLQAFHVKIDQSDSIRDCLILLLEEIEYREWLFDHLDSSRAVEVRWNYLELIIEELDKAAGDNNNLQEALSKMMLRDVLDRQEEEDTQQDSVQLMTLHSAKGLEFPIVYLTGVEEDILPHRASIESDTVDEERRLAYVGITRARKELTLTRSLKRRVQGEWIETTPSRFIDELPEDDLTYLGEFAPKQATEKNSVSFDDLRNMF